MSLDSPINMEEFEDAVIAWFKNATGLESIWAQQSAPQPDYPFARLMITSGPILASPAWDVRLSTDLGRPAGQEVAEEAVVPCTFVIGCQVLVGNPEGRNPTKDSRFYMLKAQASLGLPSILATFRTKNISFVNAEPVQNVGALFSDSFVSRSGLDVTLGASLSVTEYVGYIAKAHVKSTELGIDKEFGDI